MSVSPFDRVSCHFKFDQKPRDPACSVGIGSRKEETQDKPVFRPAAGTRVCPLSSGLLETARHQAEAGAPTFVAPERQVVIGRN